MLNPPSPQHSSLHAFLQDQENPYRHNQIFLSECLPGRAASTRRMSSRKSNNKLKLKRAKTNFSLDPSCGQRTLTFQTFTFCPTPLLYKLTNFIQNVNFRTLSSVVPSVFYHSPPFTTALLRKNTQ